MEDKTNAVEINETELAADQSEEELLDDVSDEDSQASETKEEVEDNSDEDEDDGYEEELDKLRKQLNQAEHTIVTEKRERKEVASEVDELKNKIKSLESLTQDSIISKYTSNQNARELIKYHMENTIRSSGDFEKDVANAYAIVQANIQKKRATEVKAATVAKETAGTGGSTGSQDKPKVKKQFWSDEQISELKKRGVDPDIAWRNYQEVLTK
jgi:chromosome segregation ATPase